MNFLNFVTNEEDTTLSSLRKATFSRIIKLPFKVSSFLFKCSFAGMVWIFKNFKGTLYNAVLQSRTSTDTVDLNINSCEE